MTRRKQQIMNDKELQRLFERFSEPILRPCISSAQKEKAIGISKLLWLPLITETDSEQSIYDLLAGLLKDDHNAIIALGSLYFFKMKPALTRRELSKLAKHYRKPHNLDSLSDWFEAIGFLNGH